MPGKRVQFDDRDVGAHRGCEMRDTRSSFKELTDEAFADLLKKHKRSRSG